LNRKFGDSYFDAVQQPSMADRTGRVTEAGSGTSVILATFSLYVGGKRRAYRDSNQNPQCEVVECDAEYQAQSSAYSYRLSAHRVRLHAVLPQ
jgi:hypothetical protein